MNQPRRPYSKFSKDVITLQALRFEALHGYHDFEREKGNTFEIDLMAAGDFTPSTEEDDLSKTFDYAEAEKLVLEIFMGPSEKLIETLCKRTGEKIMEQFSQVEELTVALRKCNPPIEHPAAYAEIRMSWKRS